MHLKDNQHLYQAYAHKIRHVSVDFKSSSSGDQEEGHNQDFAWDSLSIGLLQADPMVDVDDIIILSDVNEIPDPR